MSESSNVTAKNGYERFRALVEGELKRNPKGLTWTEIRKNLGKRARTQLLVDSISATSAVTSNVLGVCHIDFGVDSSAQELIKLKRKSTPLPTSPLPIHRDYRVSERAMGLMRVMR